MCLHDHPHPGPPQGSGHYDIAGKRWWDGNLGRWIPFGVGEDTLEVSVELVERPPRLRSFLDRMIGANEPVTYRFVAAGTSDDPRWREFQLGSDTFSLAESSNVDDLVSGSRDFDLADQRLTELRAELLRCGWDPVGHGQTWWSQQFTRQRLDWPTEVVGVDTNAEPSPQLD